MVVPAVINMFSNSDHLVATLVTTRPHCPNHLQHRATMPSATATEAVPIETAHEDMIVCKNINITS
jgi:hypothetical protein